MSFSPKLFSKTKYHLSYVPKYAQQYVKLFNWRKKSKILDIGTGPGHLLSLVEPLFPKDYAEIVCLDKSEKMIKYFDSMKKDPRMKSYKMDIQTAELPNELKGRFDFIFSCNTLMYLSDIRQAFDNISQMLTRNGELFFIFAKKADVYDFYKSMSKIEKWAPYMNEFNNWRNYFDTDNPTDVLKTELNRVGIEVLKSEQIDLIFEDDDKQNFIEVYDSLDSISEDIPETEILQYKKDYHKAMSHKFIGIRNGYNRMKYKLDFGSVVVGARKTC
ncbi:hypothetical protein WA026_023062 [Henosepilachna vigintioctopunctata]|uniref:Methyltransferase type 12 domain-containing protein n=1 Tax=Henosepilachna vigintioctopunctata TaxID=420089 RepID=A0AAW1V460_9CUCU